MKLVPKRLALQLTGLTPAKLREWTSRRALIPADQPARKQGSSAQFSWQTILVLRMAVILKDKFRLELQAHRHLFAGLRRALKSRSFIALWGQALVLRSPNDWSFVDVGHADRSRDDAIIVHLDPHLEILAVGFALPRPAEAAGQFDLFPALPVAASPAKAPMVAVETRRRSA
ncbi:hypothetical protein [Sphingomonas colocasiae]|uniref:HTH merR-type domain-containing protein n=1 Tax=Sphingomonas colocasiae TaxID=1848973 RepID=A0ABS7PQ98_9SPHN|nr:hypothetical protein [Sphingomonas colocasiae]MBY8823366.1 hypothetical protein [Sphingomonas colocasiae]